MASPSICLSQVGQRRCNALLERAAGIQRQSLYGKMFKCLSFLIVGEAAVCRPLRWASNALTKPPIAQRSGRDALNDLQMCSNLLGHVCYPFKHKGEAPWAVENDRQALLYQQIIGQFQQ